MLELDSLAPGDPPASGAGEPRIGVYLCRCGGNIGDVVDCDKVARALGASAHVIVARADASLCSDAGQTILAADIREHGVNRIVIGACSPALHEQTFRRAVTRAGLNAYLYHHVGLREQNSWVHHGDPEGATEKALRLMEAGIAKAELLEPLDPIRLPAQRHALVIGGGVAGLRAALDIARQGIRVSLTEKTPFLGGRMAQLETTFPAGRPAREDLHELIRNVLAHPGITVYTQAEPAGVTGCVGDFQVTVRREARGVSDGGAHVDAAIAACPVEVPDEFEYGLSTRKAIYRAYPGCYPQTAAIDWAHCTRCGACRDAGGSGIDLGAEPQTFQIHVGAIVVATGFRPYQPRHGEYGFGELPEVLPLAAFIRLLARTGAGEPLAWNGRPVRDIAMIHCVGSRQVDGVHEPQPDGQVNDYCSRVCCTATLHTANALMRRFPRINVFDVYEDIRTYGRGHEAEYTQACANTVRFLRFHAEEMPAVFRAPDGDSHPVLVRVKDYLTRGEELDIPVDLVVLATGIMPNPIAELFPMLKIAPGADRFLLEVHPKLRPVETAAPGVVLAGTAQGPMNIQESCAAASAAAAKVAALLGQGLVELEPFVAQVDPARCTGTGNCVEACPYPGAIALQTVRLDGREARRAAVTPANCVGCGICVSVCPNRAVDVQGWKLDQYEAMVDAIGADVPALEGV